MSLEDVRGLRLLLVSFIDRHPWTGMGRWSLRLSEELAALGCHPTAWFADDFPGVRAAGRGAVMAFPWVLARRIRHERASFDAVVIHEPSAWAYGLARRAFRSSPPLVTMCHNVESKVFRLLRRAAAEGLADVPVASRIKAPIFRLWQSDLGIRLADRVVCLSTEDQQYIVSRLGRNAEQVLRITNGVDAETPEPRTGIITRVLFVGGWLDIKGRRVVPRLWNLVRKSRPDVRLTTLGTGLSAEQVLTDFATEDRRSVTVIPRVMDQSAMRAEYAGHDVLLLPSLSEGSPLVLLEAMASGLPVVGSRVGGIPDVLRHEVDGFLFDPRHPDEGAALLGRLLREPVRAASMGLAASERARGFSWADTARSLANAAAMASR